MAEDVITLLEREHQQIRDLLGTVAVATGQQRRRAFEQLVRTLSVHEAAEEQVVYPQVRQLPGGAPIAEARLSEETRVKQLLAELDRMGPTSPIFKERFNALREAVLTHVEREEREVLPDLRDHCSAEQLRGMAVLVRAAEALAPTHPHPEVPPTGRATLLTGAPLAVADRARDLARDAGRVIRAVYTRRG